MRQFLTAAILVGTLVAPASSAENEAMETPPCSGSEYRQLDFWVGTWDLTWTNQDGTKAKGRNVISRSLGNCVIEERFSAFGGERPFAGMSVSTYDAEARGWRQTWVDNSGNYMPFEGGPTDEDFQFRLAKPNQETVKRMIWKNVTGDSLDWHWQQSKDEGKTWENIWVIHYERSE